MVKRLAAGVLVAGMGVGLYGLHHEDVVDFRQPYGSDGLQTPIEFDAQQAHIKKHAAERKIAALLAKVRGKNTEESDKKIASPDLVQKALERVRTGTSPRCPEKTETEIKYRVLFDPDDPASQLCLDTTQARTAYSPENDMRVIFSLAANPQYQKASYLDLKATLGSITKEQCRPLSERMISYGEYLLRQTQVIPDGQATDVAVVVQHGTPTNCDSYEQKSGWGQGLYNPKYR